MHPDNIKQDKPKILRDRNTFLYIGSFIVLVLWFITDPDSGIITNLTSGSSTIATLLILLKSIIYIALLHIARKALLDYLDLEELFSKAKRSPEGSGLAAIAVSFIMIAIAIVIFAATNI